MQVDISIYDATGKIEQVISCPESMVSIQQYPDGGGYVDGSWDGRTHYVLTSFDNTVIQRPSMPQVSIDKTSILSDGSDLATINGLPEPCTVLFQEEEYDVTDGVFSFTVDAPGTYIIKVKAWPYLDSEFTVEAMES
jgi:hypothetical protein